MPTSEQSELLKRLIQLKEILKQKYTQSKKLDQQLIKDLILYIDKSLQGSRFKSDEKD